MKALRFYAFADNLQNLSVEQMSDLPVHPGEAKIKIVAACVNPSDVKNAQGHIPATTLRRTPGRDFAGIVIDGPENLLNTQVWAAAVILDSFATAATLNSWSFPPKPFLPNLATSPLNKRPASASISSPPTRDSSAAPT